MQRGNGQGNPRNQLRLKAPDGDDILRIYQIAAMQRVKDVWQYLREFSDWAVAGYDTVNADGTDTG